MDGNALGDGCVALLDLFLWPCTRHGSVMPESTGVKYQNLLPHASSRARFYSEYDVLGFSDKGRYEGAMLELLTNTE